MSNRRVRAAKLRSEPYVPLELCSEILSRLPVKSLLRFRCVSKSWRSLIDDPQFCDLHSNAFKNNSHDTHLLILQTHKYSHSSSSLIVCRQTLEKTKWISAFSGMDAETGESWYFGFSVDGLVLLINRGNEPMLWNPSIRRCRRIPHSRVDSFNHIGMGFDPVTKDYKYVKTYFRNARRRVAVYSVRTNSWKTCRVRGLTGDVCWNPDAGQPVNFRGSLYIIQKQKVLVSFSLCTKVFTHKNLPHAMSDKRMCLLLALGDGGSSLAVIGRPCPGPGPGDCIIWALETNSNSESGGAVSLCWIKRFTITMDFVDLFFYPKSWGDMVFQRRNGKLLGKVELVSYNMETQEERILQRKCSECTSYVTVYVESLLLLN